MKFLYEKQQELTEKFLLSLSVERNLIPKNTLRLPVRSNSLK